VEVAAAAADDGWGRSGPRATPCLARRPGKESPMTASTTSRRALALGLAVLCVASAAALVWLLQRQSSASPGGLAEPAERERVMSVTDQFVKRLGTYGPDLVDDSGQMPDYRKQVREVITPKFAADFDEQVTTAEQL